MTRSINSVKFTLHPEWDAVVAASIQAEECVSVGGAPDDRNAAKSADRPVGFVAPATATPQASAMRAALAALVTLWRREQGLSPEALAQRADVDVAEIVSVERAEPVALAPRSVWKLAGTMGVPAERLMVLAGLATSSDSGFQQNAVRFAAKSESIQRLSPEDKRALNEFVKLLAT